jgi:hypothetical protein
MNITSNSTPVLNAENFRAGNTANRKMTETSFSNFEKPDDSSTLISRLSSANKEELAEKFLTSSAFRHRTKRSISEAGAPTQPNINRSDFLDRHDDLINIPSMSRIQPTCVRSADGSANPPVPTGYARWEAFFASDGHSSVIKNPKEELTEILSGKVVNCVFKEVPIVSRFSRHYNDFKIDINLATTRESAKSKFDTYKAKVDGIYVEMMSKKSILTDAIIQKMAEALQQVKYGMPNRWLEGSCWSFTTDATEWNQQWQSRYLPRALQAISNVPDMMDHIFISPRNKWINDGIKILSDYITTKGWGTFVASGEEVTLPVVPVIQNAQNTQQTNSSPVREEHTATTVN